ncbi:MAG: DNA-binding protein [Myxococcaceae bacterium]|nr:DNA-binding protein [Myxococcaceae bacterium]
MPTNDDIARGLDRVAELLELQAANPFRVHAYRHAADAVRELDEPVSAVLAREGQTGLKALGIGQAIASVVEELHRTGHLRMLERLERELPPLQRLQQVPGLGPRLARQVYAALHVETLEELEVAAHDGSLERLPGFGPRRTQLVRDAVAGRLQRSGRSTRVSAGPSPPRTPPPHLPALHPQRPPVAMLLDVDAEYRKRADAGALPTIAPRRFNPKHVTWLPVLHTTRNGLRFTALFSNTARAHQLGTTHDWVVLYWGHDHQESQCTVVTEHRGPLAGRRVVRGRELECARHYGIGWQRPLPLAPGRAAS